VIWNDYNNADATILSTKRMKDFIFRYLHGIHQLYRRNDDAEIYVMFILIFFESIFIICLGAIFGFHIPRSEELGNKWLVRFVAGFTLWLINKFLFAIQESNYSKYEPMSKGITLFITFLYFGITITFLLVSSENH